MGALAAGLAVGLAGCAHPPSAAPFPLEGTYWRLSSLDGAAIAQPTGAAREVHVVLEPASRRATGFGGCNRFTARYVLDGPALRLDAGAATRMACRDGMAQEQAFMKAMGTVAGWRVQGERLQWLDAGRTVIAEFTSGSERWACENGQPLYVHYDNADPQRPAALLSFMGKSYAMRGAPVASGARYVIEQGRNPDMSLEWRAKGDEGMLMEAPLSDSRMAADLRVVSRCKRN